MPSWETKLKKYVERKTAELYRSSAAAVLNGDRRPAFNYRFAHTCAVVAAAEELLVSEGGDRDVVIAAAYLHDVTKGLPAPKGRRGPKDRHHEDGAKTARRVLGRFGFPKRKIPDVADAILKHRSLVKDWVVEPLEAAIVWDADKLSKIGVSLVTHYLLLAPLIGEDTSNEGIVEGLADWGVLSRRIQASFNTKAAKRTGRRKLAEYDRFVDRLRKEFGHGR